MFAPLPWLSALVPLFALSFQAPPAPAEPTPDYLVYELLVYRDRVESDGTQTRVIDARALLRNAAAVSALGQLEWPYVDTFAEVAFEDVVIQKADGRKVEVKDGLVEDLNPFGITGTPIAADVRFKKLTIPGLEPGDRLSYRLVHRQKPLAPGRAFGEVKLTPTLGDPVQTYELDLPRSSGIRVRLREGIGVGWEDVPAPADRLVRRLRLRVPRQSPDDLKTLTTKKLQEWAEPDVIFTSFGSWNEVAQWWWGLSRERLQPDASVRTQAESLAAPGLAARQKLERLHAFVAGSIRYLNVNFGVGRMQPRPAPQVLANRYGDCKDKHALLAALAASSGIDVRPVLIDSVGSDLRDDVPAPQQFDHMVSVARLGPEPEDWLWLDGTDRFGVPGYLAPGLRDKRALLVEPSGEGHIVRTPSEPPFVAKTDVELKGALQIDGVLRGRAVWRFRSDEEVQLRAILEAVPEDRRRDLVKASLASDWTDAKITNVFVSDLSSVAEPLRIEFDAEQSAPVGFATGDRSLWVPLPRFGLPEAEETASPDAETIELGLREFAARAEVEMPEGLSARAPLSVSVERPFGKFASVYAVEGRRLTLSRSLTLSQRSIPREEAASYNGFRKAISTDRDQKFLILGDMAPAAATSPEALHSEGLAAFEKKDYGKAVELLQTATEADPKTKDAFFDLGRALYWAGRNEEAVAAFSRQTEITPFHESAYAWRAYALERLGRSEAADKDLVKQIEVAPFQAWVYEKLASRRMWQKRFHDAAELYARAAAIEPKGAGRWVDLGWAYARDGRAEDARAALAQARSLDLPDWMKISAGGAYALIGEWTTAAELASNGLASVAPRLAVLAADAVSENDLWGAEYLARAWYVIGSAALASGDQATAERYLDAAWKIWYLPEAAWALGNLREKQGRPAEAAEHWSLAAFVPGAWWSLPVDLDNKYFARMSPVSMSNDRLRELSSITLAGPVLADLTEEVLLLVGTDGKIETVQNRSRTNPGGLDRQLASAGTIRLGFTRPDDKPFKVVRRGVLACSLASACVLSLDVAGSGELRTLFTDSNAFGRPPKPASAGPPLERVWSIEGVWGGVAVPEASDVAYATRGPQLYSVKVANGRNFVIRDDLPWPPDWRGRRLRASRPGSQPVLVSFDRDAVTAHDADGRTLWTYTPHHLIFDVALTDINGDGRSETIVGLGGRSGVCALDTSGRALWSNSSAGSVWNVTAGSLDGGALRVLATSGTGEVQVFSAAGEHVRSQKTSCTVTTIRVADKAVIGGTAVDGSAVGTLEPLGWLVELTGEGADITSLAVAAGVPWVAAGTYSGKVFVLRLSDGAVAGVADVGRAPELSWAVTDQFPLLLVAGENHLEAFRVVPAKSAVTSSSAH